MGSRILSLETILNDCPFKLLESAGSKSTERATGQEYSLFFCSVIVVIGNWYEIIVPASLFPFVQKVDN